MALVDYSDSEGSDAEPGPARPQESTPRSVGASKSGFQKVVDKLNPHRIRVELPTFSEEGDVNGPQNEQHRPAKRAKTAGAFSGFNSFLPAPKNLKPANGAPTAGLLKGRPTGLKQGVSLKTGAAPAFSRSLPTETEDEQQWNAEDGQHPQPLDLERDDGAEPELGNASANGSKDVQPMSKPMMFKPLSVGRKSAKKKKKPPAEDTTIASSASSRTVGDDSGAMTSQSTANTLPVVPKPKKSLFSSFDHETTSTTQSAANGDYEPLLAESDDETKDYNGEEQIKELTLSSAEASQAATQPSDLNALADKLGLTPAQRRQLFGRNATAKGTEVAHFSVSAEYSNNSHMIANEANAAPAHNPVRSIAPGKHSLQQLLNAANSQKDALEESFATGKRNRSEAGNKYGW